MRMIHVCEIWSAFPRSPRQSCLLLFAMLVARERDTQQATDLCKVCSAAEPYTEYLVQSSADSTYDNL